MACQHTNSNYGKLIAINLLDTAGVPQAIYINILIYKNY